MTIETKKHIELLSQIPIECFHNTKKIEKQNIKYGTLAFYYRDLALSLFPAKYIIECMPHIHQNNLWYEFLDYVDPKRNHICGYVYKNALSLPKMHKNILVNSRQSNTFAIAKNKQGVKFREIIDLKKAFLQTASAPIFNDDFLANCYCALKKLIEKAEIIPNKKFCTDQGSIILAKELIDLLYNQNIIHNAYHEILYAPNNRVKIITDIKKHKKAMFGELQR